MDEKEAGDRDSRRDRETAMTSSRKVAAILPAAGVGLRMAHETPKQLLQVHGCSILGHTIRAMRQVTKIELIVVVTSEALLSRVQDEVSRLDTFISRNSVLPEASSEEAGRTTQRPSARVEVVCRSRDAIDSRHASIARGVEYLRGRGFDLVVVHDAVRPIVPVKLLEELFSAAEGHGAAGPCVPLVSTVLRIDANGLLEEAIPRYPDSLGRLHVSSETPQVFQYDVLAKAYSLCDEYELLHGTECLELVRRYCGVRARLLAGEPDRLWKVTLPRDLLLAERELKRPESPNDPPSLSTSSY